MPTKVSLLHTPVIKRPLTIMQRGLSVVWLVSVLLGLCPLSTNANDQADVTTGSFENPPSHVRPKFRYWIPDASVDPDVVAQDVAAAGKIGAGGLELLGYYLYGGPPSNGAGRGDFAPVDWGTYGFGTAAWSRHILLPIGLIYL